MHFSVLNFSLVLRILHTCSLFRPVEKVLINQLQPSLAIFICIAILTTLAPIEMGKSDTTRLSDLLHSPHLKNSCSRFFKFLTKHHPPTFGDLLCPQRDVLCYLFIHARLIFTSLMFPYINLSTRHLHRFLKETSARACMPTSKFIRLYLSPKFLGSKCTHPFETTGNPQILFRVPASIVFS